VVIQATAVLVVLLTKVLKHLPQVRAAVVAAAA